jgi:Icc-related predicted phosphoesterase
MSKSLRIFFTTDLHGSTICFRRFLNAVNAEGLKPNVLIVGGDITGKRVMGVFKAENGYYRQIRGYETVVVAQDEEQYKEFETITENQGSYIAFYNSEAEARRVEYDPNERKKVGEELMKQRVKSWVTLAETRLEGTGVKLVINTGNDDPFCVDEIIRASKMVIFPEGQSIDLGNSVFLLSLGYSNITPWKMDREKGEDGLRSAIGELVSKIPPGTNFTERVIFNFHCPPYGTELDIAPAIDEATLRPLVDALGPREIHAGSQAVREAIESWKPCLSLHGHIHEAYASSKIGPTICCNPGSEYHTGQLRGVLATFDGDGRFEKAHLYRVSEMLSDPERNDMFFAGVQASIPWVGKIIDKLKGGQQARNSTAMLERISLQMTNLDCSVKAMAARLDAIEASVGKPPPPQK